MASTPGICSQREGDCPVLVPTLLPDETWVLRRSRAEPGARQPFVQLRTDRSVSLPRTQYFLQKQLNQFLKM